MKANRKELIRQYQETPRTMGVGAVRNTANGRLLVVASQDLTSLLNRNQAQLRLGVHQNKALQQDWNEFGRDAFVFEVLDRLAPPADQPDYDATDDLRALEMLWLEKLAPYEPAGYHRPPRPTA